MMGFDFLLFFFFHFFLFSCLCHFGPPCFSPGSSLRRLLGSLQVASSFTAFIIYPLSCCHSPFFSLCILLYLINQSHAKLNPLAPPKSISQTFPNKPVSHSSSPREQSPCFLQVATHYHIFFFFFFLLEIFPFPLFSFFFISFGPSLHLHPQKLIIPSLSFPLSYLPLHSQYRSAWL